MAEQINILSPFYIARNFSECYTCSANIPVISIATENFNLFNGAVSEPHKHGFTFFYMPEFLGEEVSKIIKTKFDYYRLFFSNTVNKEYWANHCIYCGKGQGDFYLHSEPGGAFFPIDKTDFKNIELITIQAKSVVRIEAEYSIRTNTEQILKYARIVPLNRI